MSVITMEGALVLLQPAALMPRILMVAAGRRLFA
jgi:hypothetical protein